MSVALGISLGTESCLLAVSTTAGRFDVVADDMGERATPFYVSFSNEEVLVGLSAKNAAVRKPKNTVHGILALLSANEDSDVNALKLTCDVDTDADGSGVVLTSVADCGDEATDISRTPNDVILEYFGRLSVLLTNAAGNSSIGSVVVAVPRGTNTGKVIDAVHRSGMVPHSATVRVVFDDECAAATIRPDAFAADTVATAAATEHALIVDWGANTLSVSLLALHASSVEPVRAATSLGKVGGRQLDKALCNTIADAFQRKTRADPREEPRSMRKLALSVEKTKMALSVSQNASVELEAFCNGADLNEPLSRMKLEMAFDTLGAAAVLDQLLSQVVDGASVQYVVFAGGMCRVPRVQALIRNAVAKFCASAQIVDKGAPDEVAALGACIAAQSLPHSRSSWLDGDIQATVLPYALVAATADGSHFALVDAQEPLPTTRTVKFATPPAGQPQPLVLGALADGAVSWLAKADVPPNCPGVDIVVDADGTITVRALDAFSKRKGAVLVTLSPAN